MTKKGQEMLLLYLHALNHKPSHVQTLPRKRSTVKTLAEVRSLLADESNHFFKGKTKQKIFNDLKVLMVQ